MRVLNIGSINIDHVYGVDHFVQPGETIGSSRCSIFAGGKGFNQSVALARAGTAVCHAGSVGKDGGWLLERLQQENVDTTRVTVTAVPTGHAMIQVVPSGENAIVLYGGANHSVSEDDVNAALSACLPGDYLLIQNETSSVAHAIQAAHEKGLPVVFNPAPMTAAVRHYPLGCVDIFILNETEAEELTGKVRPEDVVATMRARYPRSATVLTRGEKGAVYFDAKAVLEQPAFAVDVVDTTAAGDTFAGYFLAKMIQTGSPGEALVHGCRAAAMCVTRAGASDSIPRKGELERMPLSHRA